MRDKLISVIVPIYNIEDYVGQCLKSISAQTYERLEIILVDDGSTDKSGAICDEAARLDERIRVIHKANGGLSDARNVGIEAASGELLGFVDGDDMIAPRFYELMLAQMLTHDCDIVECHHVKFADTDTPVPIYSDRAVQMSPFRWLTESGYGSFIPCVAWNKLYRREVFDGVRFPIGRKYEDEATVYKAVYRARSIIRMSSALYFYRTRLGSITESRLTLSDLEQKYTALAEKCDFFESVGEKRIRRAASARLGVFMAFNHSSYTELGGDGRAWRESIRDILHDTFAEVCVPLKYKLYLAAFLLCPAIVSKVIG